MSTVSTRAPIVRAAGEGEQRWFHGGGLHTWKAGDAETGGAFLLFEAHMERGKVTPLHTHPADETMYVIDGEIVVHMDGVEHRVETGGVAVAPRGVPHAFLVVSDAARVLFLHTPGGCEGFYRDASEPAGADPMSGPVDFARIEESAARNGGIEILGPPPFPG